MSSSLYASVPERSNERKQTTDYVVKTAKLIQERSVLLLQSQLATERAIACVQEMKAQLVRERREKRDREITFLQSRAAPLVEFLADTRDDHESENTQAYAMPSHQQTAEGLRAVVREAMRRVREEKELGRLASSRLCVGTNVHRSACGRKLRVVIDASYRGARLERYAVILQLQSAVLPDASEPTERRENAKGSMATHERHKRKTRAASPVTVENPAPQLCPDSDAYDIGRSSPGPLSGPENGKSDAIQGTEVWTVAEHSLPKFIPVSQLVVRHLACNMRSFVAQLKDYVQAFASRREQWHELLRSFAPSSRAYAEASSARALQQTIPIAAQRFPSNLEISEPRVSDAYDHLSFILHVAGATSPHGSRDCAEENLRHDGSGTGDGHGGGGAEGLFKIQLVFDDLRRAIASR